LITYNDNFSRHIVTIEEPMSYVHDNKRSIITSVSSGRFRIISSRVEGCLARNADIVLVGEMRDWKRFSVALTAAEDGLLVFGTLHTNNSRKTVDRMVDVFPGAATAAARTMLANSLRGGSRNCFEKADGFKVASQ